MNEDLEENVVKAKRLLSPASSDAIEAPGKKVDKGKGGDFSKGGKGSDISNGKDGGGGGGSSTGGVGGGPLDPILAAIAALSEKMDTKMEKMVTKEDFDVFKQNAQRDIKIIISEAVDPI